MYIVWFQLHCGKSKIMESWRISGHQRYWRRERWIDRTSYSVRYDHARCMPVYIRQHPWTMQQKLWKLIWMLFDKDVSILVHGFDKCIPFCTRCWWRGRLFVGTASIMWELYFIEEFQVYSKLIKKYILLILHN